MRIEGVIAESDYVAGQFLHLRPRPLFALLGALLIAGLVWALATTWSPVLFIAVAYLVVWFVVLMPWRAKKNYRQYKALSEMVSIEVRGDGLYFQRDNGEGLLPWSEIVKWRRSKKLMIQYPASNLFHLVPSHFFSSSADYEKFIDTVQQQVGDAT